MTKRAGKKKSPSPAETIGKVPNGKEPDSRKPGKIATSPPDIQSSNSVFWPELSAQNIAAAIARAGSGEGGNSAIDSLKRLSDMRLELRAVKERWPIPEAVRERLVAETSILACNQKAQARERLFAIRLLLQMDAMNIKPKDLPDQIDSGAAVKQTINVTIGAVVQQLQQITGDSDIDFRDYKVIEGSADDYAD